MWPPRGSHLRPGDPPGRGRGARDLVGEHPQASKRPPAPASNESRPSILLIDDDATLGALMSEYFAAEGFRLAMASDGRAGLARALQGGIDLVILDVSLPLLDGFEVLRQLRQRSAVPV